MCLSSARFGCSLRLWRLIHSWRELPGVVFRLRPLFSGPGCVFWRAWSALLLRSVVCIGVLVGPVGLLWRVQFPGRSLLFLSDDGVFVVDQFQGDEYLVVFRHCGHVGP